MSEVGYVADRQKMSHIPVLHIYMMSGNKNTHYTTKFQRNLVLLIVFGKQWQ